jgi:hypothetical protein
LVAIGWLVREGRKDSFLPWEKTTLLVACLASIGEYAIGSTWHLPLGPFISLAVLALALRRITGSLTSMGGLITGQAGSGHWVAKAATSESLDCGAPGRLVP